MIGSTGSPTTLATCVPGGNLAFGLAAAYCFEDNAKDSVGSANGNIVGNNNFVPGLRGGKAISFDGSTYVHMVNNLNCVAHAASFP